MFRETAKQVEWKKSNGEIVCGWCLFYRVDLQPKIFAAEKSTHIRLFPERDLTFDRASASLPPNTDWYTFTCMSLGLSFAFSV